MSKQVEKSCSVCGKSFKVAGYRADTAKTCSYECYHKSRRKEAKRVCACCGEEFETSKAALRDVGGSKSAGKKYCSLKCRDTARNKRETKLCEICGSPFEVKAYRATKATTCSPSCAGIRRSRMMSEGKMKQGYRHSFRGVFLDNRGVEHGYDSTWELLRMHQLEGLGLDWKRDHCIVIPYTDARGVERSYVPDFWVSNRKGKVWLEEIKPVWRKKRGRTQAKHVAARKYCKERGWEFRVLGEEELGILAGGRLKEKLGKAAYLKDLLNKDSQQPNEGQKRIDAWLYKEEICKAYLSGETMTLLSKRYATSAPTIMRILKQSNIETRNRGRKSKKDCGSAT